MKYRIILEADDGENVLFTPIIQVECGAPSDELEAEITNGVNAEVQRISTRNPNEIAAYLLDSGRGRPAKAVYVAGVDDPATAPSGVKIGLTVRSSMDLSRMLGYGYNMVLQAFSRAKTAREKEVSKLESLQAQVEARKETLYANLRGVTFCYVSDLQGQA